MVRLRRGALEWEQVDGELVVLDLALRCHLVVNGTGTVLWPLLEAGCEAEDLARHLVEAYAIEADSARRHAAAFVSALAEHGMLEPE